MPDTTTHPHDTLSQGVTTAHAASARRATTDVGGWLVLPDPLPLDGLELSTIDDRPVWDRIDHYQCADVVDTFVDDTVRHGDDHALAICPWRTPRMRTLWHALTTHPATY